MLTVLPFNNGKFKPWRRTHKDTRNLFRLENEIKEIKGIVFRIIRMFFEYEKEEEYY